MSPFDLICAGQFAEAVVAYERLIGGEPDNAINYRGRGQALLLLGKPAAARAAFETAMRIDRGPRPAKDRYPSDGDVKSIGVTYWVEGERSRAGYLWLEMVEALEKNRVDYTDPAGGVEAGSLLWFAGVHLEEQEFFDATQSLFKKLSTRSKWGGLETWPGPIAKYLMGREDEAWLLASIQQAPVLSDRRHAQAWFAIAAQRLRAGDSAAYRDLMTQIAALPPHASLENEYLLARHESAVA